MIGLTTWSRSPIVAAARAADSPRRSAKGRSVALPSPARSLAEDRLGRLPDQRSLRRKRSLPRRWPHHAHDAQHRRTLAGAIDPDQADDLTLVDMQRDARAAPGSPRSGRADRSTSSRLKPPPRRPDRLRSRPVPAHFVRQCLPRSSAVVQDVDAVAQAHDQSHVVVDDQDAATNLLPDRGQASAAKLRLQHRSTRLPAHRAAERTGSVANARAISTRRSSPCGKHPGLAVPPGAKCRRVPALARAAACFAHAKRRSR